MTTNIIAIGNSLGVRIPKILLRESGLEGEVEIKVKKGEIRITAVKTNVKTINPSLVLSEKTLGSDWNRSSEDKAWKSLQ